MCVESFRKLLTHLALTSRRVSCFLSVPVSVSRYAPELDDIRCLYQHSSQHNCMAPRAEHNSRPDEQSCLVQLQPAQHTSIHPEVLMFPFNFSHKAAFLRLRVCLFQQQRGSAVLCVEKMLVSLFPRKAASKQVQGLETRPRGLVHSA